MSSTADWVGPDRLVRGGRRLTATGRHSFTSGSETGLLASPHDEEDVAILAWVLAEQLDLVLASSRHSERIRIVRVPLSEALHACGQGYVVVLPPHPMSRMRCAWVS